MDAGELGTFLGGSVLFIDVDDHHFDMANNRAFQIADDFCLKGFEPCMASEDETASVHQASTGSLSHASFGATEVDGMAEDDGPAQKRFRSTTDMAGLAFEVESPTSYVHTSSLALTTPPATDSMAIFFPPPPAHLTSSEAPDGTRIFGVGVGTPLLPPPPNADGVALGLPCAADMSLLRTMYGTWPTSVAVAQPQPQPVVAQAQAPSTTQYQYCQSAFTVPQLPSASVDIAEVLQDVLRGKLRTPPLGLKLDIAAVVNEMSGPMSG